jgi:hypothetical protein
MSVLHPIRPQCLTPPLALRSFDKFEEAVFTTGRSRAYSRSPTFWDKWTLIDYLALNKTKVKFRE